jgi:hypothetical protein
VSIVDRTARLLQKSGDEIGIITVIIIMNQREYEALDTPEALMIVESIKRSTNELGPDASLDDVAEYVSQIDTDGMAGFINNIKGIYHEMEFVEAENTDGDHVFARLHTATNHPGSDVMLFDKGSGAVVEVQLKATDDPGLVENALARYPDTQVYVTTETAVLFKDNPMVHNSGFSSREITGQVESELGDIKAAGAGPLDFIPQMALWSTALATTPVIKEWWRGRITREECTAKVAKITGLIAAKVAAILALLAFPPTSAPTSIYLVARVCYEVFRAYRG